SEKYEFIGINSPEDIVDNLRYIRSNLPKDTTLAVMLGGELYYEKNTFPAYENRHIVHKKINEAIRNAAEELDIKLIDVNKYLVDQSSFYDHFNHYIKPVYYALAGEIVDLVNEKTGSNMKETAKSKMLAVRIKEVLAPIYYKLRKSVKRK
ncbi:MAG: SGNH/GDSL hydrolase family protein, partial [Eubacteriales bacterium]|nr:SGNH/GDSL hydrolase family protein [Eubacteriales bacterium]